MAAAAQSGGDSYVITASCADRSADLEQLKLVAWRFGRSLSDGFSWSGFFRQVVEGALVGGAAGGISGAELSGINYTVHHFPALK